MITVSIAQKAGRFAENKDVARDIRIQQIVPALNQDQKVVLDFENVDSATQSFIHALISEIVKAYGKDVLERMSFKSCTQTIQKLIALVVEYTQE